MKTSLKLVMALLPALAVFATAALAADPVETEPTLKVGSPAPKLQNGQTVQGDTIKAFQPGKAYIVEFWATWCGPCRASIPHLNEIYTKFKDKGLVVIGQDCWEQDDKLVEPFVKKMGDKMTYCVALDDKTGDTKGKMADAWMAAAGRKGIPSAFLIDTKGVIAWIGHPMELPEQAIQEVLDGKFDMAKAAADYDKQLKQDAALRKEIAPMTAKMNAMRKAMREGKWDEAGQDLTEAEKVTPETRRDAMGMTFAVNRFDILIGKKDFSDAGKLAVKLSDASKNSASVQNYLAWEIVTAKGNDKPDLDLAEKLIDRAVDASKGEDPQILDTQARILFMKGQKDEAVQAQTKAVALAESDMKESLQKRLDSYKKGELPATN